MLNLRASVVTAGMAAALLLNGCTAGQIVDSNFNAYSVGDGGVTFAAVDSTGHLTGTSYEFALATNGSVVSFDPDAPASAANVKVTIPAGNYVVTLFSDTDPSFRAGSASSPIFEHTYDPNGCTDFYTQQHDEWCALYYFQISNNCPTCCDRGGTCALTPLQTGGPNGYKIVPLKHP